MERLSRKLAETAIERGLEDDWEYFETEAETNPAKRSSQNANEFLVAVMGITGSGKSTFIETVTGCEEISNDDLDSGTREVQSYTTYIDGLKVVLVDTPGFDDNFVSDMTILQKISKWVSKSYEEGRMLSGIVYLHPIKQPRMAGSAKRSLSTLQAMCGEDFYKNLALCTTFWDEVPDSQGVSREKELLENREFWKDMVNQGSKTYRLSRQKGECLDVLRKILKNQPARLLLNEELDAAGNNWDDTTAARVTGGNMEQLRKMHEEMMAAAKQETETLLRQQQEHHDRQLKSTIFQMEIMFQAERNEIEEKKNAEIERLKANHTRKEMESRLLQSEKDEDAIVERERLQRMITELKQERQNHSQFLDRMRNEMRDTYIEEKQEQEKIWKKRLKNKEAEGRQKTSEANSQAIEQMLQIYGNVAMITGQKAPVDPKHYLSLLTTCDSCFNPLGGGTFYNCSICSNPEIESASFDICRRCHADDRRCLNTDHTLSRENLTDEIRWRCKRPSETTSQVTCDRCFRPCKLIYFHCCDCKNGGETCQFDVCIACLTIGLTCNDKTHLLKIAAAPV